MDTHAPVRHVVVFRYKDALSAADIERIRAAFCALPKLIPGITALEHGVNNSPEGLNKRLTHVFQLTFTDAAARDTYLPHPAHAAFGALLGELDALADLFVVDYTPAK